MLDIDLKMSFNYFLVLSFLFVLTYTYAKPIETNPLQNLLNHAKPVESDPNLPKVRAKRRLTLRKPSFEEN